MSLLNKIDSIQKKFLSELSSATNDSSKLSDLYNKYLGRKGLVSNLFSELSAVSSKDKPIVGQKINSLRNSIQKSFDQFELNKNKTKISSDIDLTLPGNHFFEKYSITPFKSEKLTFLSTYNPSI